MACYGARDISDGFRSLSCRCGWVFGCAAVAKKFRRRRQLGRNGCAARKKGQKPHFGHSSATSSRSFFKAIWCKRKKQPLELVENSSQLPQGLQEKNEPFGGVSPALVSDEVGATALKRRLWDSNHLFLRTARYVPETPPGKPLQIKDFIKSEFLT